MFLIVLLSKLEFENKIRIINIIKEFRSIAIKKG